MDQAVIGAAVGATIQVVLQNVLSVSIEEIKRVYGFKKDLSKLKESLELIQDFLYDAEMKQVNDRAVKRWLGQLEDVAFKADVVLDEFNYELLRKKVKKQKGETNKVTTFFPRVSRKLLFSIRMASKIKDVNNELERIDKEASSFGLQAAVTGAGHSSILGLNKHCLDSAQTNSFSAEPNIIGRDDDVLKMVNLLVTAPTDRTFSVIPIVGMGGIGKTTLARTVFHHERIGPHFNGKIWVSVSVNFDAMDLFKMILETLTGESTHAILSEEAVLGKIRNNLEGKKYLLVLDDVWNENSNEWDSFLSSLSGISSVMGNCILVTTRSEIVASNLQTLPTPPLRTLSGDECWSIIKSRAIQSVDVPTDFEEVGRFIAQQCSGLPLAAKVVGGLLRGKSKDEWQSILTNQLLRFGPGDSVTKILKLSYDRLPSYLHKKCFAYCSIFPQDFRINKKKLIELWMAEGFLQADEGKDMETVGDEIFNHLRQNSLFQDESWDRFGDPLYCNMHDLVHDLACSITKGAHRVRYIVIESLTDKPDAISQEQMMYLRSLFFNGKIIDNMFSYFIRLCVLNLRGVKIEKIPTVIGRFKHLRLFNISKTGVKQLPDSIGKLYHLQSLWICDFGEEIISLKILPSTIIEMISLRHLHIPDSVQLPPCIGNLTSLRTLPYYKVGHEKGCRIGELGKLTNLKGEVEIQNLERVKDKAEAKQAGLSRKPEILRLVFKWNESRQDDERNDEYVLDGLQPHPSLKSFEIVGYSGRIFPRWAMKMEAHNDIQGSCELLHNLIELKIGNCMRCEEVPMLGHLPHLKFLTLDGLSKLQTIGRSFYGITGDTYYHDEPIIAFPALEELKLLSMPELTEWTEVDGVFIVFPCLQYMEIKLCPKLRSVPSHFTCLKELKVYGVDPGFSLLHLCSSTSHLHSINITELPGLAYFPEELLMKNQNLTKLRIERCHKLTGLVPNELSGGSAGSLEELHISRCSELETISCVKSFTSLRKLGISWCGNLRKLDLDTVQFLEELRVSHCPEVESIIPSVNGLTSLQKLNISWCGKLREIPLDLNSLGSLEELVLENCAELKSIISYARGGGDSQQPQQHGVIITSVRVLRISNCRALVDIPIELFQSCSSSLQYLTLYRIPKWMNIPSREISRRLRSLGIGGFSDSISFDSFNQHLNQLLQNSCSLEDLYLHGKEDWNSLPDQIQHLAALRHLHLHDFGTIESLPEWIGNLSSLKCLWIRNCKRLKHLPSKEAMLSLTKLHTLYVRDSPLLAERCRDPSSATTTTAAAAADASSEWPKISHIKDVLIDY